MFTGIITHQSRIVAIDNGTFIVENTLGDELSIGQSIAHDGACMSITELDTDTYSFFAMEESFRKTNFGSKKPGDLFNIELCLQATSRIDGHFVSGHIDTNGTIKTIKHGSDGSQLLGVSFDKDLSDYVIPKGSIAINGVSLTVVDTAPGYLSVWLIPITLEKTNLGLMKLGTVVNLEFDMLGKYIVQYTKNTQTGQ